MKQSCGGEIRPPNTLRLFFMLPTLCGALACGGSGNSKGTAEAYDEDRGQLTNAVVQTLSGTTTIGPTGEIDSAPVGTGSGSGGVVGVGSSGGVSLGGSSGGVVGEEDGGFEEDGGTSDSGAGGGFGQWHFDDCSPKSNFLLDSSPFHDDAGHALGAACVQGASGLAVDIRSAKDVITVPDQPQFALGTRVAVAAWVKPSTVSGDQPIVIKRLQNKTAFSLGIHDGNIEMSVVLSTGKTYVSSAPISPGVWTHVAGMYDGEFVYLFIDGQQFGQLYAAGTLRDVYAPVLVGATSQTQYLHGIVDEVFVSTEAMTAQQIEALACLSQPSTLAVNPPVGGPVPFDTSVHYAVTVTDNDFGFCPARSYNLFASSSDPTVIETADPPQSVSNVQPGGTASFGLDVSVSDEGTPGLHQAPIQIFDFSSTFEFLSGQVSIEISQPTGCFVTTGEELMLTDTSIVDDPVRTFGVFVPSSSSGGGGEGGIEPGDSGVVFPLNAVPASAPASSGDAETVGSGDSGTTIVTVDGGSSPDLGVWTFGHLMRDMAPTEDQAPAMVLQLFQTWLTDQTVNGFTVAARPAMQQVLLDVWPKTPTGDLDLDQPPLTLQAIVNRIDLRNLANGSAGETRFVFAVNGQGFPQSFTVIVEYSMPATTQEDVQDWANRWHALSTHPFPSEGYNAALEAITTSITQRNAGAGRVNGSNLVQLRTNEIALSFQWELRSFVLAPSTGFFSETTDDDTPDISFNGSQAFADFVNQNAAAIIAVVPGAMANLVPPTFEGQSFAAGSIFNNQVEWSASGILDPDARFHTSLNTCNGCHGPETNTLNFTMIDPRNFGTPSSLSPFLTGTTVTDQFSGQVRALNDLERRRQDLESLVCGVDGGAPPVADGGLAPPVVDGGTPAPGEDAEVARN
jgi:hypothetical protein